MASLFHSLGTRKAVGVIWFWVLGWGTGFLRSWLKSTCSNQGEVRSGRWGGQVWLSPLGFRAVQMGGRHQSLVNAGGVGAVVGARPTAGCRACGERLKCLQLSCHMGEGQGHLGSCHGTTEGAEAASKAGGGGVRGGRGQVT